MKETEAAVVKCINSYKEYLELPEVEREKGTSFTTASSERVRRETEETERLFEALAMALAIEQTMVRHPTVLEFEETQAAFSGFASHGGDLNMVSQRDSGQETKPRCLPDTDFTSVTKLRSPYSLTAGEGSSYIPLYDEFKTPSLPLLNFKAAYMRHAVCLDGVEVPLPETRTRLMLVSGQNGSDRAVVEEITIRRSRSAYNAVLGTSIDLETRAREYLSARNAAEGSRSRAAGNDTSERRASF